MNDSNSMLSPELGPRGGQFDSDFSFFPSPSLPMHPHFPRPSKMDRMLHLLLLQNCCLHCSKQVNCPHLTVYPNESSPEKEESRYTSRTSSEEEGSTRKTSHTYRLQKRIQHLRGGCTTKSTDSSAWTPTPPITEPPTTTWYRTCKKLNHAGREG